MSCAQAAGAGASFGANSGSQSKDKFHNEKMVVCLIKGFTYDQLTEELNKVGIWKAVSGYQRVDFNRRIVMVVEDPEIRTFLAEKGFNVNGVHVFFSYHKRRVDLKTRVYTSQLKSVQSALSDLLTTSATHGTFSRPSTKRGPILIGLELNTNARESFEHC